MTNESLARSYLKKAKDRRKVLDLLIEEQAFSDVVREAQELVELALKGMLRAVGIDPPKLHDVGSLLSTIGRDFPLTYRRSWSGWRPSPRGCGKSGSWPSTGMWISSDRGVCTDPRAGSP